VAPTSKRGEGKRGERKAERGKEGESRGEVTGGKERGAEDASPNVYHRAPDSLAMPLRTYNRQCLVSNFAHYLTFFVRPRILLQIMQR